MSGSTTRQTAIGIVFLGLGLFLIGTAVAPVVIGMLEHPVTHADVTLSVLFVGLAVSLFGALLIPFSGAAPALQVFVTLAAPYIPKLGGNRAGDPPAPPTGGTP